MPYLLFNIKSYHMKTKETVAIVLQHEYRSANVVTGAQLNLSLADARALYLLTAIDMPMDRPDKSNYIHGTDEDSMYAKDMKRYNEQQDAVNPESISRQGETCRHILRNIAKAILLTSGDATDLNEFITKFK